MKQTLEQSATSFIDSTQQTLDAFVEATTSAEMRQAVTLYPRLAEAEFITLIEQQIREQIPVEYQAGFNERFT